MILDDLKNSTRKRVEACRKIIPDAELEKLLDKRPEREPFVFEKALNKTGMSYICEIKKASPSKGIIAGHFPYRDIAREYESAGADCISVLTEPEYFLGDIKYLREIRELVHTPILRKDFTCDPYMVTEAAVNGADAVLLIAAILSDDELRTLFNLAEELGLSVIFEAHDKTEIDRCIAAGARIIGVNNRNLRDFSVNVENSGALRQAVPDDIIFVAESGISTAEDVRALKQIGVDACLIGETLMRADDKGAKLRELDA